MVLRRVSSFGVAPKPYWGNDDIIIMELVEGPTLEEALGLGMDLRKLVEEALYSALVLDAAGVLHHELSRPYRHILYSGYYTGAKALFVDFESASVGECGNLNKIFSFILNKFVREKVSLELRMRLREYRRSSCIEKLGYRIVEEVLSLL
jgi:predicted Ser/Thr protein kinase